MDINKQIEIIRRGAVEIISEDELRIKLQESVRTKRPLRIKAGFDPTSPDIHLGHTVLLRKLRQFQDLGHQVVFLIGDFTARIGDPSGRQETRKQLTIDEVLANAATYKNQVSKILDVDKPARQWFGSPYKPEGDGAASDSRSHSQSHKPARQWFGFPYKPEGDGAASDSRSHSQSHKMQIAFNSEWFDKMSVLDVLKLTTHATVTQMLARSDFKKRLSKSENISLLEFMYPLLQGYDSVKLEADIELGGTDQLFNLLMGRDIQKDFHQAQQVVITMPLLEGTDGIQKMSKSYANFIAINDNPNEMFGKIMSISDEMMLKYYMLLTDEDLEAVRKKHPKEAKLNLAENITRQYHGRELAEKARQEFEQVFSKRELPQDIPVYKLKKQRPSIIDILLDSGLTESKNEARRLLKQGGVSLGGVRLDKEDIIVDKEGILKVGKRRFLRLIKVK